MESSLGHDDPSSLGEYRLIARLGSGGMGTVYLGRSPGGRTVALKTMHADFAADPEFRTRFRLEVDAARVIGGEYGAAVVDADPLAEVPWLATEYVLGPPLDEAVAVCGGLPEEAARVLGARLCEALSQLHNSGVVHRDLKPSNILIAATGPKLIDFGIARAAGDDRLTRTGTAAGTPAFMSPEQATGGEHGPAGDVFALAGVLVFALTGHGPFGTGQTADLLYRVRYGEADLTAVPPEMQPLLASCLSKVPDQRPGTTQLGSSLSETHGEFADFLPDAVHAEVLRRSEAVWEIEPSRLPLWEDDFTTVAPHSRERSVRRRRALVAGAGTLFAAGGVAAGWAWLGTDESGRPARSSSGSQPVGAAPKPHWKTAVSGAAEFQVFLAEDYLMMSSEAGLTSVAVKSGKQGVINREALDYSLPVADGKRIYGIDSSNAAVALIDAKTVQFRNQVTPGEDLDVKNPRLLTTHGGLIFYTGTAGKPNGEEVSLRLAIRTDTGEEQWRQEISTPESTAQVVAWKAGVLVLALENVETMWGVSTRTGKKIWSNSFPPNGEGEERVVAFSHGRGASHYYLGFQEIIAVGIIDGKVSWRFGKERSNPTRKERSMFYGVPIFHDGVVYAVEMGYGIVALDAESGTLLWELETDWAADASYLSIPAAGTGYVYFSVDKGRWFAAIDCEKRREAWVFSGSDEAGYTDLLAAPSAKKLIAVNGNTVLAFPLE
ncbi:serine/threonine-protein kinase [Streptomyces sp. N2-109]|uniref:Serine/threonine-protein kinase n=1 Tax=Streptomyces gossypii TaxID=2883101 RepID=A0ABT2K3L8_9ACTN|nr:serine/threonine-protein kinase [Streptomyces gossypii]MCT2594691.1 serine/threonine-protein kinase [Streptomyces gossypii]